MCASYAISSYLKHGIARAGFELIFQITDDCSLAIIFQHAVRTFAFVGMPGAVNVSALRKDLDAPEEFISSHRDRSQYRTLLSG
jgi:hypothetical protein